MFKKITPLFWIALFVWSVGLADLNAQTMFFDSNSNKVTQLEIDAFKTYVKKEVMLPTYHGGNVWVFGSQGRVIEACGQMFEVSKDVEILDEMVKLCDAALAGRNDLAPAANGGQQKAWTGQVEPIWPSSKVGVTPIGGGIEQGRVLSHLAFCAFQILQTPSIWNTPVSIGDPFRFGATYRERALKYVHESDYVIDRWILPHFIRTSDRNRYYFPGAPNTYKVNEPAPWNQAWMLTDALVRLTQCHGLLGDAPTRIKQYDAIVQPNIDWFFSSLQPATSNSGSKCWKWLYSLSQTNTEDSNHAAYDVEGLYIAYSSGRYGITFSDMVPFANTYFDIVLTTSQQGKFAGRIDATTGVGNAGGDNYVCEEYIYLLDFRPEKFSEVLEIEKNANKIATSPLITARLLWQKNRRSGLKVIQKS
ncbi:MAG TPA: hypothetical protein VFP20_04295 [Bacteroidales bacterium]|nr:hypothetical protein [Bacteroidales bacterium]